MQCKKKNTIMQPGVRMDALRYSYEKEKSQCWSKVVVYRATSITYRTYLSKSTTVGSLNKR